MKVLVKVIEHQFIDTVITQEIIDSEVVIENSLTDFGVASFTVPVISIEEDNIVEIYEIGNADKRMFRGYVYKVEPVWKQWGLLRVECRSEKAIMNKRRALKTKASFNVREVGSLPVRPTFPNFWVNYWVNQSLTWVYIYLDTVFPEPPESWPTPDPYHNYWFVPFTDTTFVITDWWNVWRIEDWQLLNEWTGTGVDISMILNDLIDDYSNQYNENWAFGTDFTQNISLNIKKWDNYFDVLDELAEQTGAVWDIKDKEIIFKRNIGVDKTSWPDYVEINYNWLFPNSSNIANINVIGTATRSNIVLWQDQNWHIIVNDSWYVDRIYGVGKKEFRDGDLWQNTNKFLENANRQQRLYQLQVESNTINADVGDKVKLVVENTNQFYDIDTDAVVLWKTITYTNGSKRVDYNIGELNLYVATVDSRLYGMKKSIKYMQVK